MHVIPAITGFALWLAGTALLLEGAYQSGHWDVAHLAVPILTGSTCVAGVLAHKAIARLKLLSGAALIALALLGSALCVLNTLGRTADARDGAEATIQATNRTYGYKSDELEAARANAAKECRSIGPKCRTWQARIDELTSELAGIVVRSTDARADAIARLAVLVGLDGERSKQIVRAVEPAALPLFLELGAIVLLGVAFPTRRKATVTVSQSVLTVSPESVEKVFSRANAFDDFRRLKASGSQQFLAGRWGVSESTVSKWLAGWESDGLVSRNRDGKQRAVLALPAPRSCAFKRV